MNNPKTIRFRVDREQHERINNKARAKGYASVSEYMRHLALEKDMVIEQYVLETHETVLELHTLLKHLRANQKSRPV